MSVLHDYRCDGHGVFESTTGECPHGCHPSLVSKVFLKAVGTISDRTSGIDRTFEALAGDFGMTDMNNQNGTSSVKRPDPKLMSERERILSEMAPQWGKLAAGGTFKPGTGAVPVEGRNGNGAQASAASLGLSGQPDSFVLDSLKSLPPVKPMVVGRHDAPLEK